MHRPSHASHRTSLHLRPHGLADSGDETVDLSIGGVSDETRARLDRVMEQLRAKGVRHLHYEIDPKDHRAVFHLLHATYYQLSVVSAALMGLGTVELKRQPSGQPHSEPTSDNDGGKESTVDAQ